MTIKIIPILAAGIISASYLTALAQESPKDTIQTIRQDSIYIPKSRADSLKKTNKNILELRVKEIQISGKNKVQLFYSSPNNMRVKGVKFMDKKKDVCKTIKDELPKSDDRREIVYVTEKENPFLNLDEVRDLMRCLGVEKYWVYQGDYFF